MKKEINQIAKTKTKSNPKLLKQLSKAFTEQKYADIIKSEYKFSDELFPPNNLSLYSGKSDFSKYTKPIVPDFIRVSIKQLIHIHNLYITYQLLT